MVGILEPVGTPHPVDTPRPVDILEPLDMIWDTKLATEAMADTHKGMEMAQVVAEQDRMPKHTVGPAKARVVVGSNHMEATARIPKVTVVTLPANLVDQAGQAKLPPVAATPVFRMAVAHQAVHLAGRRGTEVQLLAPHLALELQEVERKQVQEVLGRRVVLAVRRYSVLTPEVGSKGLDPESLLPQGLDWMEPVLLGEEALLPALLWRPLADIFMVRLAVLEVKLLCSTLP
jgi:hypothetical protein